MIKCNAEGAAERASEMMMCGRLIHLGLVLAALLRHSREFADRRGSLTLSTDVNVRSDDDVAFSRVPFACDANSFF